MDIVLANQVGQNERELQLQICNRNISGANLEWNPNPLQKDMQSNGINTVKISLQNGFCNRNSLAVSLQNTDLLYCACKKYPAIS